MMKNDELIKFIQTTKEIILPGVVTENEYRDFKRKWTIGKSKSKERAEFVKDIIAFANSNGKNLACIYIGIDEIRDDTGKKTGKFEIVGVEQSELLKSGAIKDILKDAIYPKISADILTIDNGDLKKTIQVLILEENTDRPYCLRHTIIKGGEFVEGSKFYRHMDSSIRVPSTSEDHFTKKWQHEDQTYHRTQLETQERKYEIFDRAKRSLKWDAELKDSYTYTKALLVTPERLQALDDYLTETFEVVSYLVYCGDNAEVSFPDIEHILAYENADAKCISGLKIEVYSPQPNSSAIIELKDSGSWSKSTAELKLYCDDIEWGLIKAPELVQHIQSFRPWYWWLQKVNFTVATPILAAISWIVFMVYWDTETNQAMSSSSEGATNKDSTTFQWFLLGVLLFFGANIDKLKNYAFPKVFFSLGKQRERFSHRQLFSAVFVAVVICTILVTITLFIKYYYVW